MKPLNVASLESKTMENIMIEQITKNWWRLTYSNPEHRWVFFGQTEDDVKSKFNSWCRRVGKAV